MKKKLRTRRAPARARVGSRLARSGADPMHRSMESPRHSDRRSFLAATGGVATGATLIGIRRGAFAGEPPKAPQPGAPSEEDIQLPARATMPMRKLGRTGVKVSLV